MKKLKTIITVFALTLSSTLFSQVYIGGSVSNSFQNLKLSGISGDNFKIDDSSVGYKIFGGIGKGFLGLEGGYRDLGEVKQTNSDVKGTSKSTGWDVAARGKLKLGPVFAFAKAGAFFQQNKYEISTETFKDNSTSFMWGLGCGLKLGPIGIRLEYESLDLSKNNNIGSLSLGATVSFGGE